MWQPLTGNPKLEQNLLYYRVRLQDDQIPDPSPDKYLAYQRVEVGRFTDLKGSFNPYTSAV